MDRRQKEREDREARVSKESDREKRQEGNNSETRTKTKMQEKEKLDRQERETEEQEEAGNELTPKKGVISNVKTWYRDQQRKKIAKAVSKTYEKERTIQLGCK